jgi:hypothetical protein
MIHLIMLKADNKGPRYKVCEEYYNACKVNDLGRIDVVNQQNAIVHPRVQSIIVMYQRSVRCQTPSKSMI